MKDKFKAIIFDLGGVILNLDYNKTSQAFKNLGVSNFDELYSQALQNNIFNDFETGQISSDEFRTYIKSISPVKLTNTQIDMAWNAMLLNLPIERVELLQVLKKTHHLVLFSNTNAIHLVALQEIIRQDHGNSNLLETLFDQTYYSHLLKQRKPNIEAFQYIIDELNLTPEETIFIDDSIQHIEGAKLSGLQCHHLVDQDILDLFKD